MKPKSKLLNRIKHVKPKMCLHLNYRWLAQPIGVMTRTPLLPLSLSPSSNIIVDKWRKKCEEATWCICTFHTPQIKRRRWINTAHKIAQFHMHLMCHQQQQQHWIPCMKCSEGYIGYIQGKGWAERSQANYCRVSASLSWWLCPETPTSAWLNAANWAFAFTHSALQTHTYKDTHTVTHKHGTHTYSTHTLRES